MRPNTFALAVAVSILPATAVSAFTAVDKNTTVNWFNDATFAQVPGQAVSQVADLGNTGAVLLPGSTASGTNCVMIPEPSFSCSGPAGLVRQHYDFTGATPPASGITALGSASSGGDTVSMSLHASSTDAPVDGLTALLYNIVGIDRQRIRFDVALAGLPEFIDIDVTFTVAAGIADQSAGVGGTYLAEASASLHVLEAATLVAPPFGTGPMLAPLVASASVNNNAGVPQDALTGITETMSVRPNAEYWVALESQAALSLVPSPGFPDRDYAGLDILLTAYADPEFALNPAFAAANPDIAAALQLNRIAVVPVPAALPLLGAALAGMVPMAARRRRRSGVPASNSPR